MSGPEHINVSTLTTEFDPNNYSSADYPEQYMPTIKSSYSQKDQDLKSIRISTEDAKIESISAIFIINAEFIARKEKIHQTEKELKRISRIY